MDLENISDNRFTYLPMEEAPIEELFARDWQELLNRYGDDVCNLLSDVFIELSFPVREGISNDAEFLNAVKHGIETPFYRRAWIPKAPEGIRVYLYPTPAGRVPVIETENDQDFIRLLRSLAFRCEPRPVPDSRGATIIKNYNNWMRIKMLRERFEQVSLDGNWGEHFAEIRDKPELYRDYIILLSNRFYSGISPDAFGLSATEWRRKSLVIRRDHEIAHYMTQRFYHSTKNEIHDEIIADYMGLTAAYGHYDPNMFLTFLGLENYPGYREGGRLEIYLDGTKTIGEEFNALCKAIHDAAFNIADYHSHVKGERMKIFHTLCRTSVTDMANGSFAKAV